MAHEPPLLVSGAGGQLGRRVVELLIEAKKGRIIATTRDPAKLADLAAKGVEVRKADFDHPETLETAFRGAERMLLISTNSIDVPGRRRRQQESAIKPPSARACATSFTPRAPCRGPRPRAPCSTITSGPSRRLRRAR